MITYTWNFLNLYATEQVLDSVEYLLSGTDGIVVVESSGNHKFKPGTVKKPLSEIVETDLIQWIEKDTTIEEINPIKLAVENRLKALENVKKVDFPWLSGTFTIE
jgi:hypothetical protein